MAATIAGDEVYVEQAARFLRDGYLVFEPDAAMTRWAEHALPIAARVVDIEAGRWRAGRSWFEGTISIAHGIRPLQAGPVAFLRRALAHPGMTLTHGQVSSVLTGFPRPTGDPTLDAWHEAGRIRHVDGTSDGRTLELFPAILGIILNDIDEEDRGNPTVWPGSHWVTAAALRSWGAQGDAREVAALLQARLPLDERAHPPRQITGRRGTAVLYHHGLHHGIGPNRRPDAAARHAIFFRVPPGPHQDIRTITEPGHGWPGLSPPPSERGAA